MYCVSECHTRRMLAASKVLEHERSHWSWALQPRKMKMKIINFPNQTDIGRIKNGSLDIHQQYPLNV